MVTQNYLQALVALGNAAATASGKGIEVINPFSHPRTLLSDFTIGEKLLQHIFLTLLGGKGRFFSPKVVIHPMEKMEGGLTTIEQRAFRELAYGAGASDDVVYQGKEIPVIEFNFETIKATSQ